MSTEQVAGVVLGALVAGLVGGGAISRMMLGALIQRLSEKFVSEKEYRSDLDQLHSLRRDKIERLERSIEAEAKARDRAIDAITHLYDRQQGAIDQLRDRIVQLDTRGQSQWDTITRHVVAPLEHLAGAVSEIQQTQAALSESMRGIAGELRSLRERHHQ